MRLGLPGTAPCRPSWRISRSTVQRATQIGLAPTLRRLRLGHGQHPASNRLKRNGPTVERQQPRHDTQIRQIATVMLLWQYPPQERLIC